MVEKTLNPIDVIAGDSRNFRGKRKVEISRRRFQQLSQYSKCLTGDYALFYLGGKYYSVGQRLSGTEYISTIARRPGAKPPSYEVLGFLLH